MYVIAQMIIYFYHFNIYSYYVIFDRCHHSWAVETPDNHEHDLMYLTFTFYKSKFVIKEKLMNGALVTPTPALHTHIYQPL